MKVSWGATSVAYCRPCARRTTWYFAGAENHVRPEVVYWRCSVDGNTRTQMADVTDSEGLVRTILERQLRSTGTVDVDREDVLGLLRAELWDLYVAWDPQAGVRFTAYATGLLRLRVNNYWRQRLGRTTPNALTGAESLDAPEVSGGVRAALAARTDDPHLLRAPDLVRTFARRRGGADLEALVRGGGPGLGGEADEAA